MSVDKLPDCYWITPAGLSETELLSQAKAKIAQGLNMLQLRGFEAAQASKLVQALRKISASVIIIINSDLDIAITAQADGVHLKHHQLMALAARPTRVANQFLLGASCHDTLSVQKAHQLGLDYISLSPVLATSTHPEVSPLGWQYLQAICAQFDLAIFALGGMQLKDIATAKDYGAHGVAGITLS